MPRKQPRSHGWIATKSEQVRVPKRREEVSVERVPVDEEDATERLEGRAESRRGEGELLDRTTAGSERRADNPGREETGKEEGFIEKAKRKLEGQ